MFLVFLYFFKDQSAIVLVYEGKHIAVLRNLEVYAHRKEERISRQFGSAHSDHPTVNVSPSEKVLYSILNKCGRVIRDLSLEVFAFQIKFLLATRPHLILNTQNMTNPTIVYLVKMEYGWNFSISGLKMMVKGGLEKIFLKFASCRSHFLLIHSTT